MEVVVEITAFTSETRGILMYLYGEPHPKFKSLSLALVSEVNKRLRTFGNCLRHSTLHALFSDSGDVEFQLKVTPSDGPAYESKVYVPAREFHHDAATVKECAEWVASSFISLFADSMLNVIRQH